MKPVIALLVALSCMALAHAHTRSQSSAVLSASGADVRLTVAVEAREVTRATALPGLALPLEEAMRLHFLKSVRVSADGLMCPATARAPAFAPVMRLEVAYGCPAGWRALTMHYNAFFDVARGHIAIVHTDVDGQPRGEAVLSRLSRELTVRREADVAGHHTAGFLAFLTMGTSHILEGVDHLCFVIGLLLMARGFLSTAVTLTGFTIGHSLTLALGVLDVVRVHPATVETLIAGTIVVVGLEALRAQGAGRRAVEWAMLAILGFGAATLIYTGGSLWLILAVSAMIVGASLSNGTEAAWRKPFLFAAGFGTIHGLAFAETLREALTPGGGFLWALLGFNLGVEIGQLIVAALAAGAFVLWRRRHAASAAIGAYGVACLLLFGGALWLAARLPMA